MISGVADGARGPTDLWLEPWESGIRFSFEAGSGDEADTMFALLKEAAESSRSVRVRFDPRSGAFDPSIGRFVYRACALGLADREASARERDCGTAAGSNPLAHGIALAAGGESRASLPELDRALAGPSGEIERAIGLRWREAALVDEATDAGTADEADRLRVRALADAREWRRLSPDDSDAALSEAANLSALGAYDESIAAYRAIANRWPVEDYRASIRIGAIRRQQRDYPAALASLDELVARTGPQEGMRFHYHRGWTLTLLGRFDEAVGELTQGIQQQPDYAWAYVRRACASASVGRTAAALLDQRRGLSLMERAAKSAELTGPEMTRARAVVAELERVERVSPGNPTDVACTSYPDQEPWRSRSPWLKR